MTVLNYVGVALQLAGVLISAAGLVATWREFAPPGERFFAPVVDPLVLLVRTAFSWSADAARKILRRPIQGKVASVQMGATVTATGSLGMTVTIAPLPQDTRAALVALHERAQMLTDMLMDTRGRIEEEFAARANEDERIREEQRLAVAKLESIDRSLAIGGLRTQAFGVFLTVLGIVLAELPA